MQSYLFSKVCFLRGISTEEVNRDFRGSFSLNMLVVSIQWPNLNVLVFFLNSVNGTRRSTLLS